MFNNLINIHDITAVYREKDKLFSRIASRMKLRRSDRVKSAWAHTEHPLQYWNDIPAVQERWNTMISGSKYKEHYEYLSEKYLNKPPYNAISLGCGTGHRELRWARLNKFEKIEAYDISESRIMSANEEAERQGLSAILDYKAGDIYSLNFPDNYYDIVITEHSLHHFSPLEELMNKINRMLKPGGLFIFNEFVGPTRFQWTDSQLDAVNSLLGTLPDKYKTLINGKTIKKREFRPGILRMIVNDPSEAVESSRILPLADKILYREEIKEYGGTILHLLFKEIAHNFINNDPETERWLRFCFDAEDDFLKRSGINSDFVLGVYRKK